MHEGGKIEVLPLCPVGDQEDLSMMYTPGVARVCNAIAADESLADEYTIRKNTVAIEPGKLDRSPCGTGCSARMAVLHARGELGVGEGALNLGHLEVGGQAVGELGLLGLEVALRELDRGHRGQRNRAIRSGVDDEVTDLADLGPVRLKCALLPLKVVKVGAYGLEGWEEAEVQEEEEW